MTQQLGGRELVGGERSGAKGRQVLKVTDPRSMQAEADRGYTQIVMRVVVLMASKLEGKLRHDDAIIAVLSRERLTKYLQHAKGEQSGALDLYELNMAVSAAFYVPLQCFEVCLRNKFHVAMSEVYGSGWLSKGSEAPLNPFSRKLIKEATGQLDQNAPSEGKLVAELKFAFWVGLAAKGYDQTLWRECLHRVFRENCPKKRHIIHGRLNAIRRLRNRIAHHEPIFHTTPEGYFHEVVEGIGWMCPETAKWATHRSNVTDILSAYDQRAKAPY